MLLAWLLLLACCCLLATVCLLLLGCLLLGRLLLLAYLIGCLLLLGYLLLVACFAAATASAPVTAAVVHTVEDNTTPLGPPTRVLRRRKRHRGRPKKNRKGAGRPSRKTPPPRVHTPPTTPVVVSPVRVPFLPRIRGRRSISSPLVSPGCVLVSNVEHNLRSDLPHMSKNSTCKVCYLHDRVCRTIYACDKCNRMICPDCFRQLDSHKSLSNLRAFLRIP